MKLLSLVLSATILIACATKNENNNNGNSNQLYTSKKKHIIQNYSSHQLKDSISGNGDKAIPVKLSKGVAIIEIKLIDNYYYNSDGTKEVGVLYLKIKRSDGQIDQDCWFFEKGISYNGSQSFSVQDDDTYTIDISTSQLCKWTLIIKQAQ